MNDRTGNRARRAVNYSESKRFCDAYPRLLRPFDIVAVIIVAAALVPFCLFYGANFVNADTALLTVMSLQKVTLFIWGQNRFLNLVPFLASPVGSPDLNLAVQLLLFGGAFGALLAMFAWVAARLMVVAHRPADFWLCFAIMLFVFAFISSPYAMHAFVSEGQPYGLSGLLFGAGLIGYLAAPALSWPRRIVAFSALFLGAGLNPSLLLVAGAICACALPCWPQYWKRLLETGCAAFIACVFWLLLSRSFPGPRGYGAFEFAQLPAHLVGAYSAIWIALDAPMLAILCGSAGIALLFAFALPNVTARRPAIWLIPSLLAVFAVGYFVLLAGNRWVVLNGWHFRYFYPVTLALIVAIATPLIVLALRAPPALRILITVLVLAAVPLRLAAPWTPIEQLPPFARVLPVVEEARAKDVRLVAGSYWVVWPAVFLLHRDGLAFGIEEERGIANGGQVRRLLDAEQRTGRASRIICLDGETERCLHQAGVVTHREWRVSAEPCTGGCRIMELAAPP
jgi:hypothetical protein